ncbi:hypothetical protein D3C85_1244140 [compost metagenome]
MLQRLDHQQPGPLPHHETVAAAIKRPRSLLRRVIESAGQGPRRGKAGQADPVDTGFGTTAQCDIRLTAANQPRRIANGLYTRRAGRNWRTQGPLEAVLDRHMAGRQVHQK